MTQRIIVITGASSGIGRETARRFAIDPTNRIVLLARREAQLRETLEACGGDSAGWIHPIDLTDLEAISAFAATLREREGACDVLINNAGAGMNTPVADDGALAQTLQLLDLNLRAPIALTLELLPLLQAARRPAVINIASVAGMIGIPQSPAYAATKFGLRGWSESLHGALASSGVHVATLQPGPVPTPGWPQEDVMKSPFGRYIATSPERVAVIIERMARVQRAPTRVTRRYWRVIAAIALIMPRTYHRMLRRSMRAG